MQNQGLVVAEQALCPLRYLSSPGVILFNTNFSRYPTLLFIDMIKTLTQTMLEETQGRNPEQELKQCPQRNSAY